jgi:hypothetical protein
MEVINKAFSSESEWLQKTREEQEVRLAQLAEARVQAANDAKEDARLFGELGAGTSKRGYEDVPANYAQGEHRPEDHLVSGDIMEDDVFDLFLPDEPQEDAWRHEEEPQEDTIPVTSDEEEDMVLAKLNQNPKKTKSPQAPKSSENVNDWGDLLTVVKFHWSVNEPMFEVKWSLVGHLKNPAVEVIIDETEACLKILWKNHRRNLRVMEWINGLKKMEDLVTDWVDIESYANLMGWEGAFAVPKAASAVGGRLEPPTENFCRDVGIEGEIDARVYCVGNQ